MTPIRRTLHAALGLASVIALGACNTQNVENFFVGFLLLVFGTVAGLGSLLGIGFTVLHMVQRRRRSAVHIVLATPFAVAAVALHSAGTFGFDHVSNRDMGWLLLLVGVPLLWLALAVIQAVLAPSPPRRRIEGRPPGPPPLTVTRVLAVVIPIVVLLGLYALLVARAAMKVPAY
ncbi:MAG: hypothetical protein QM820_36655 [Minicystis sp.]